MITGTTIWPRRLIWRPGSFLRSTSWIRIRCIGNSILTSNDDENQMAEAKTKPTRQSVKDFISKLPDKQVREDCTVIAKLMEEATKQKGVMWGTSIAGYGTTTVKYADGREADWPLIAF